MKRLTKLLAYVFAMILIFSFAGCNQNTQTIQKNPNYNVQQNVPVGSMSFFSTPSVVNEETGTSSKTVTAIITPANSVINQVDWTLVWLNGPTDGSSVSEYVTLSTATDGALTVTLTCLKPFNNYTMTLHCATRKGGLTAQCTVGYKGLPDKIVITDALGKDITRAIITIPNGETVTFNLSSTNAMGDVFDDEIVYTVDAYLFDPLKVLFEYVVNGPVRDSATVIATKSDSSRSYYETATASWTASSNYDLEQIVVKLTFTADDFIKYSIEGNQVTVKCVATSYDWRTTPFTTVRTGYRASLVNESASFLLYLRVSSAFGSDYILLNLQPSTATLSLSEYSIRI